jgi:iron uptake system component EfeO
LAVPATAAVIVGLAGCGSSTEDQPAAATPSSYDRTLLESRTAEYQAYTVREARTMLSATRTFTDAIRSGDERAAKAAYADSRYHWETIEPVAGLVSDVDGAVDSRVDDFASVTDPAFTGWHRLEYVLWRQGDIDAEAKAFATDLDRDLSSLPGLLARQQMTPHDVATGAAELIEEVSEGKITGEEDRYSHTDLYDLAANVNGSFRAFQTYEPVLATVDPALEHQIETSFLAAKQRIGQYQRADGSYQPFTAMSTADRHQLQATLASLSEDLSTVSGVLAL